MAIKAIFFDQDGVIIDTEKDGHRIAFNDTFKAMGFNTEWGVEYYHELLQIGGGKERMKHHLQTKGFGKVIPEEEVDDLIMKMHHYKTDRFIELIESGSLPLRPGIHRFMKEGEAAGLTLGVCTTSNERAAHAIAYDILKNVPFKFVLAGDIVEKKKPDPAIYLLALEKTGFQPHECLVVEDSRNGVQAAKAAGMHVIATSNFYTQREDLSAADVIVTTLGDPEGEKGQLVKGDIPDFDGVVTVAQLTKLFENE
jgi:HAD superfamily hydrolase (TIGR01509 family)